ncbi:hypothetical protein [Lignipirellula cremea]|uniref:Neutral/alkaline non-lysosomal ceramidase n=1 Tax=Lignipirellula cremea TaxID=2528010 RepID=A0A518E4S6_9BACT|nr:hypothetical protein [Lignipirellula cremea]QDU99073.1 hypothetical protein Pla8534_69840 [Lignipirellula cremea]
MPLSTRREWLSAAAAVGAASLAPQNLFAQEVPPDGFHLATFSADITPPLGHPLLAGWRKPAEKILDRLQARGIVLRGAGAPIVLAALDWCELRNDAYDFVRDALADATGTQRQRVLLACVHQHDTPLMDLEAGRLLAGVGLEGRMFDLDFFQQAISDTAQAAKKCLTRRQRITHLGVGQATVQKIACNRRVQLPGQRPTFSRYSFTRDQAIRDAPEGLIDPLLKTISFWQDDRPLAAVSCYATHPMTYYGRGEVSTDFVGLARAQRQRDNADVFQMFVTGCGGDLTAAKYNTGTSDGRQELAGRLVDGMVDAWEATQRTPLKQIAFRCGELQLPPETAGSLAPAALEAKLADTTASYQERCIAALGLSWQKRCAAGQPIDLPVVDFGDALLTLLPAEAFVAFGLAAQKMSPEQLVMAVGYGECAPGYLPTASARKEGFVHEHAYTWTAPGAEAALLQTLRTTLPARR